MSELRATSFVIVTSEKRVTPTKGVGFFATEFFLKENKLSALRAISDVNADPRMKVLNVFLLDEDGGTVPHDVTVKDYEIDLVPLYEQRGG
ncbi:hypothetical protein [Salibacterium lacus]|uniref:Uncharacterized protein n=1 Tax=Salibacterium lacus TaxID=1898109 RepID=A0ABW5T1S6_9BACI